MEASAGPMPYTLPKSAFSRIGISIVTTARIPAGRGTSAGTSAGGPAFPCRFQSPRRRRTRSACTRSMIGSRASRQALPPSVARAFSRFTVSQRQQHRPGASRHHDLDSIVWGGSVRLGPQVVGSRKHRERTWQQSACRHPPRDGQRCAIQRLHQPGGQPHWQRLRALPSCRPRAS